MCSWLIWREWSQTHSDINCVTQTEIIIFTSTCEENPKCYRHFDQPCICIKINCCNIQRACDSKLQKFCIMTSIYIYIYTHIYINLFVGIWMRCNIWVEYIWILIYYMYMRCNQICLIVSMRLYWTCHHKCALNCMLYPLCFFKFD